MFITLEGGEGAGKSTQARMLADALIGAGFAVLVTREPGGAPGAETLRALLLDGAHDWSAPAETYLHFAARAEHLARTIQPALARSEVVICDRFADSTMAYQGDGQGAARALVASLTSLLPVMPDLTLVLDVSPAAAARRLLARPQRLDRYERMDAGFHARVRAGFLRIAAAEPGRCVIIDADADLDVVHRAIRQAVALRLDGFA